MTIFSIVIGGLFFIGLGIALYEWRMKTVLLKHDFHLLSKNQTEADRELERSTAAMRDKFMFDHMQ